MKTQDVLIPMVVPSKPIQTLGSRVRVLLGSRIFVRPLMMGPCGDLIIQGVLLIVLIIFRKSVQQRRPRPESSCSFKKRKVGRLAQIKRDA
jgi:hypothetical protein